MAINLAPLRAGFTFLGTGPLAPLRPSATLSEPPSPHINACAGWPNPLVGKRRGLGILVDYEARNRADALVMETGQTADSFDWRAATRRLQTADKFDAVETMKMVLYRAMAAAELKAPASAKGTFIPVGNSFDAFAALAKVLQTATADVLIVDPYMDETALTEFGGAVPSGVTLRLLADQATQKPTLQPAAVKWVAQYGATRPLQFRLAPSKALHDRAIFIERTTAWTLTAEIVRADDTAALKIAAYEEIWAKAQIVV
jgi:hypothetical protein